MKLYCGWLSLLSGLLGLSVEAPTMSLILEGFYELGLCFNTHPWQDCGRGPHVCPCSLRLPQSMLVEHAKGVNGSLTWYQCQQGNNTS